jgi:hypothetical protein
MRPRARREANALEKECRRFTRYLIRQEPGELQIRLYERAVETLPDLASRRADPFLRAARTAWLIPYLDAGTAWMRIDCLFRRRLMLMAAILEVSPRNTGRFLPRDVSIAGLLLLGLRSGLRTAFVLPLGILLVRVMNRP